MTCLRRLCAELHRRNPFDAEEWMKRLLVMLVSAIVSVVVASIVQAAPTESTGDTGSSDLTREPRTAWAAALESKTRSPPKFGSSALSPQTQNLKISPDEARI